MERKNYISFLSKRNRNTNNFRYESEESATTSFFQMVNRKSSLLEDIDHPKPKTPL